MIGLQASFACTLNPTVVLPTAGSMRPPPVNFCPAGQPSQNSGAPSSTGDWFGSGLTGRSQARPTSAATVTAHSAAQPLLFVSLLM